MNEKIMKEAGFELELGRVVCGHCPICDIEIDPTKFRDELSKREYKISGLCQKCQDKTFGV